MTDQPTTSAPRTAAALAVLESLMALHHHPPYDDLHDGVWHLLDMLHVEQVLERLTAAEAVVETVKQRRLDAMLRQGDGAANERAITDALIAYNATRKGAGDATG